MVEKMTGNAPEAISDNTKDNKNPVGGGMPPDPHTVLVIIILPPVQVISK